MNGLFSSPFRGQTYEGTAFNPWRPPISRNTTVPIPSELKVVEADVSATFRRTTYVRQDEAHADDLHGIAEGDPVFFKPNDASTSSSAEPIGHVLSLAQLNHHLRNNEKFDAEAPGAQKIVDKLHREWRFAGVSLVNVTDGSHVKNPRVPIVITGQVNTLDYWPNAKPGYRLYLVMEIVKPENGTWKEAYVRISPSRGLKDAHVARPEPKAGDPKVRGYHILVGEVRHYEKNISDSVPDIGLIGSDRSDLIARSASMKLTEIIISCPKFIMR